MFGGHMIGAEQPQRVGKIDPLGDGSTFAELTMLA
jgi:hypothetical protein